jgi:hypothetical protein
MKLKATIRPGRGKLTIKNKNPSRGIVSKTQPTSPTLYIKGPKRSNP